MVGSLLASSSGGAGTGILVVIYLVIIVFEIAALWKVFVKAGEAGWLAIIPIVNLIFTLKIIGRKWPWIFIILVPIVGGLILGILIAIDLAKSFGKSGAFAVGLFFLSFIFIPILGFGPATYRGPAAAAGPGQPYQGGPGQGYAAPGPYAQAPGQQYPAAPGQGYPQPPTA